MNEGAEQIARRNMDAAPKRNRLWMRHAFAHAPTHLDF